MKSNITIFIFRDVSEVSKTRMAKKFDRLPHGMSEIVEGFLWLGSGRDGS